MLAKLALAVLGMGLTVLGCQTTDDGSGVKAAGHGSGHQMPDAPSTHGMLVFGDGPVYLSHLPMFHSPHNYQVLMEVDLQKAGADPVADYVNDRHVTGEKVYTFVPETFSLPELFGPTGGLPQRTTFKGTLFRGHFERGGSPFIANVTAKVKRLIYVKKFDPNATALPELAYFVFGSDQAMYAAHVIAKVPDFDHVVSLSVLSGVPSDQAAEALKRGLMLTFAGVANDADHALKEGQESTATLSANGDSVNLQVEPVTDFYLETGDLAE